LLRAGLKYFGSNLEEAGQILYLGSQGFYGKNASSAPVQTDKVIPESPSHRATFPAAMPPAEIVASQNRVTESVVNKVIEGESEDSRADAHGCLCEALVSGLPSNVMADHYYWLYFLNERLPAF
jgi:hypothetical protein